MQKKLIPYTEFKAVLVSGYQRSYATYSPFTPVSLPTNTLFTTWSGMLSQTSGPCILLGGFEVCRFDFNDPVLLNFDLYSIYSVTIPSLVELIGPKKPAYHWSGDLPIEMKQDAPNWVKILISQIYSSVQLNLCH